MEHSTEILYNRTRVYCSAVHRFGSDALLLARFSEPKRAWRAADLCSGCGIVSLEWHDRGHRGPCLGLELQPEASALLAAACAEQGIAHITPVCADLRSFREGEGSYDLCACNPPYFTAGEQAADRARATARHETDCTLDDVCKCAFRLLKDGGRLSLCASSWLPRRTAPPRRPRCLMCPKDRRSVRPACSPSKKVTWLGEGGLWIQYTVK